MKNKLLLLLVAILPSIGFTQVDIPHIPSPSIPAISSGYWDNPANWPLALTNGNLRYTLSFRITDPSDALTSCYSNAIASGSEYSARYHIVPSSVRRDPEQQPMNEWEVTFGPQYGWRVDGSVYLQGFQHPEGVEELYYFTTNGSVAKAWFTDHRDNRSVMVLYNSSNEICGYSEAPEKTDQPYTGVIRSVLNSQEVPDCDFFAAFKEHRIIELGRENTQQSGPAYPPQGVGSADP